MRALPRRGLTPPPLRQSHRPIAPRSVRDRARHPTPACCACRWPPHRRNARVRRAEKYAGRLPIADYACARRGTLHNCARTDRRPLDLFRREFWRAHLSRGAHAEEREAEARGHKSVHAVAIGCIISGISANVVRAAQEPPGPRGSVFPAPGHRGAPEAFTYPWPRASPARFLKSLLARAPLVIVVKAPAMLEFAPAGSWLTAARRARPDALCARPWG
jgi:hypothetical protein